MRSGEASEAGPSFNFYCPNCNHLLSYRVSQMGATPARPLTKEERAELWRANATEPIKKFLAEAEQNGVFASFQKAVADMPAHSRPVNLYRYFFTMLMGLAPYTSVRMDIFQRIQREFGGRCTVWQASGGIAAVTSDGQLRAFASIATLIAAPSAPKAQSHVSDFSGEWIKTRFGYVTSPILLDEYRKKSLGAWDSIAQ